MANSFGVTATPDVVAPLRSRRARLLRVAIVLIVVAAIVGVVWSTGLVDQVRDRDELEQTIEDAGLWGPLVFLALMVLFVPLNVPGLVFVVPATTLFGTPLGLTLALTGGFVASTVGIVAARTLGRRAFEARMPARIRRWEAILSKRGLWAVVTLRCFTFLFQPSDWLCGLSSIPMRTVLLGTLIGLIPPTLVVALTGDGLLGLLL